ncbi:MAG: hypothetical protein U0174_28480 [Polyangiaceae bacterium]
MRFATTRFESIRPLFPSRTVAGLMLGGALVLACASDDGAEHAADEGDARDPNATLATGDERDPEGDPGEGTSANALVTTGKDAGADAKTDAKGDGSTPRDAGNTRDASMLPRDAGADARPDGGIVGTAGCGKAATSGASSKTITIGALNRTFILSIPAGYNAARPYPLVFGWHGQSGTAAHFRAGDTTYAGHGGGVEDAAANRAIFVYPQGTVREANKTGWKIGTGIDLDFFDALVTKLSADLCVDATRIFSFGYSYGARMSNQLACMRPNVLRAIASVAGYIGTNGTQNIGTCTPGAVGTWFHTSDDDNVVPATWGKTTRDYWHDAHTCTNATMVGSPTSCVSYQGCDAGSPLTFCNPTGYKHAWPAYAEAAIWKFFAAF